MDNCFWVLKCQPLCIYLCLIMSCLFSMVGAGSCEEAAGLGFHPGPLDSGIQASPPQTPFLGCSGCSSALFLALHSTATQPEVTRALTFTHHPLKHHCWPLLQSTGMSIPFWTMTGSFSGNFGDLFVVHICKRGLPEATNLLLYMWPAVWENSHQIKNSILVTNIQPKWFTTSLFSKNWRTVFSDLASMQYLLLLLRSIGAF